MKTWNETREVLEAARACLADGRSCAIPSRLADPEITHREFLPEVQRPVGHGATGIGVPVYDDLRHVIPRIEPVKLTNLSKAQLIQRLIVAIEQRQIGWPAAWSVVTDELKRYEYEITPNGSITYNTPGGYHDDSVIALGLANSERFQFKWTGEARIFGARKVMPLVRFGGGAIAYASGRYVNI